MTKSMNYTSAFKRDLKHVDANLLEKVRNIIGRLQYGFELPAKVKHEHINN